VVEAGRSTVRRARGNGAIAPFREARRRASHPAGIPAGAGPLRGAVPAVRAETLAPIGLNVWPAFPM